jgi:TonB family protein
VIAWTQRRLRQDKRYKNANEAWKAQWNDLLAWSTMFAVAAHVAVFVFWPAWDDSDSFLDPDLELLGTAWIALYPPPSSGGGGSGTAASALAVVETPDSLLLEEVDAAALIGGAGVVVASVPQGLRERLAGRGGPVPTIVQFGPAFGPAFGPSAGPPGLGNDRADNREEVVVETDDPTTEDLALLLEATPLDLSRLSAVRPQIVLPGTSAWILIRNPAEVDRFMTGVAYGVDSQLEGLVDVAVWIDEWGSVEWAEISRSSGRQEMDEVALALFTKVASFRPARDRGVRVSLSAIFSVPFPW